MIKQKARVIDALRAWGPMTSTEVEAVTGISRAKCAHYLQQLADVDEVAVRQRNATRYPTKYGNLGRFSHRYSLKRVQVMPGNRAQTA